MKSENQAYSGYLYPFFENGLSEFLCRQLSRNLTKMPIYLIFPHQRKIKYI